MFNKPKIRIFLIIINKIILSSQKKKSFLIIENINLSKISIEKIIISN